MSDYSITDYMISYNFYETSDFIFNNFSIYRVVTYLLQSSNSLFYNIFELLDFILFQSIFLDFIFIFIFLYFLRVMWLQSHNVSHNIML